MKKTIKIEKYRNKNEKKTRKRKALKKKKIESHLRRDLSVYLRNFVQGLLSFCSVLKRNEIKKRKKQRKEKKETKRKEENLEIRIDSLTSSRYLATHRFVLPEGKKAKGQWERKNKNKMKIIVSFIINLIIMAGNSKEFVQCIFKILFSRERTNQKKNTREKRKRERQRKKERRREREIKKRKET